MWDLRALRGVGLESGRLLRSLEGHTGRGERRGADGGRAHRLRLRRTTRSRCGTWRAGACCAPWKGTPAAVDAVALTGGRAHRLRLSGQHDQGVGPGERAPAAHPGRAHRRGDIRGADAGRAHRLRLRRTTRSRCGTWRAGGLLRTLKGHTSGVTRRGADPGRAHRLRLRVTRRSRCGTWRAGACCAPSKATPTG